jgi:hypothetical protein
MAGRRMALLVATDSYLDSGFSRLRAPQADVRGLQEVLEDSAVGGYQVEVLTNEPSHVVNEAIEGFLDAATVRDMVLLYFSGHGFKDDRGRLYVITENSRRDRLNATAVTADFVRERLDNCRSRGKLLLLDCCYAGAFPVGATPKGPQAIDVLDRLSGRGSAVMTASSAIELAFEGANAEASAISQLPAPSVFTRALIEGLRSGNADVNGDGLIDFDELYDYVYARVRDSVPQQSPRRSSELEGTLYVAVSPSGARPAQLSAELGEAINSPLASVKRFAVEDLVALSVGAHPGMLLTINHVLERLAKDSDRDVAAAATAALRQVEEMSVRDHIFLSSGAAVREAPSPAALVAVAAAAEPGVARLRKAAYQEIAARREAAELASDALKASAEREAEAIRTKAARESDELKAMTDREVAKLRATADHEVAEKRAWNEREVAKMRTTAEREVAQMRASSKRDRDEILTTARRQADEMRSQAQRAFEDSEAAQAQAKAELDELEAKKLSISAYLARIGEVLESDSPGPAGSQKHVTTDQPDVGTSTPRRRGLLHSRDNRPGI